MSGEKPVKRSTILRKPGKVGGGDAAQAPGLASQKIKKVKAQRSVLKGLYSALQVVAARHKGKGQVTGLNEAIDAFLAHLDTRSAEVLKTQIGSRGLQLCLKHGMSRHRQHVLLAVLRQNVLNLMNSRYGVFLFSRLFKFCSHEPQYKLLDDFMQKSMVDVMQLKEGLLVVGAYIDTQTQAEQLSFHFEKMSTVALPDFFLEELLAEKVYQRRYLLCTLTHSLLLHQFSRIKAKIDDLVENLCGFFHLCTRKRGTLVPLVGLLCRLYASVGWAGRKTMLKTFFRERFLEYYKREPCFIILFFVVLAHAQKTASLDLTVVEQLRGGFSEVVNDAIGVKLLVYLLAEDGFFAQDVTFAQGRPLHALIGLDNTLQTQSFDHNRRHVAAAVMSVEHLSQCLGYNWVREKAVQNSTFAIFYGLVVGWLVQDSGRGREVDAVFTEFFDHASSEVLSLPEGDEGSQGFFFSAIGHRLYKKLVQTLRGASEENKRVIERVLRRFIEGVQPQLARLVTTKAVFVLVAVLEHSEMAEKVKFELRKLDLVAEASTFPGLRILINILRN